MYKILLSTEKVTVQNVGVNTREKWATHVMQRVSERITDSVDMVHKQAHYNCLSWDSSRLYYMRYMAK